jgi:hypothetical protein
MLFIVCFYRKFYRIEVDGKARTLLLAPTPVGLRKMWYSHDLRSSDELQECHANAQIEKLRNGDTLPEHEVKALCDKVRGRY